jgi:hypothetical protein
MRSGNLQTVAPDLLDALPESDKTIWVVVPIEGWAAAPCVERLTPVRAKTEQWSGRPS